MRGNITEGTTFPDYELPDHNRKLKKLSEIQGADALIIILARGYQCRGDRLQHRLLIPFYPELQEGFTKILTIISGNWKAANAFRSRIGAKWPFLYDSRNVIAKDLDIEDKYSEQEKSIIPHTFILMQGLVIYKIYNGYWYWDRPAIEDLRKDLRDLHRKIRPQWDPSNPDFPDTRLV